MSLNIMRNRATPESNHAASELLNSFKAIGVTFGYWTNKVISEIEKLITEDKQVEDYDLAQLRELAGKDVREFYAKMTVAVKMA